MSYVVVVLALLVVVNVIGSKLTTTWDLTSTHSLTLSQASKNILAKLKQNVTIYAFEIPGTSTGRQVQTLLEQYKRYGNGHVSYQMVDPDANPALADHFKITTAGEIVVLAGQNTQTVQPSDLQSYDSAGNPVFNGEAAITNAILRAGTPVQLTVDFVTGNGEPDISQGRLPDAVQALKDQGYNVGSISLLTGSGVPANVSALIIASPQNDLSPVEIKVLQNYAAAGGHILFLLDPLVKPLTNLDNLLLSWGVTPQNDLVADASGTNHFQTDPFTLIPNYVASSITDPLQQANLPSVLPGAQGLTIGKPSAYTVTPILTTSSGTSGGQPTSWGITDVKNLQSTGGAYQAGDVKGPLTLGVSIVENAGGSGSSTSSANSGTAAAGVGVKQFRAVVFGNSVFISSNGGGGNISPITYFPGNRNLFLNSVGWLTGLTQGISLPTNPGSSSQVTLSGSQARIIMDTFLIGIPLVCFALAFSTWWSRRKL